MKERVFLCISTSLNNIYSAKKFLVFCYVSIMIYHQRPANMHVENILSICLSISLHTLQVCEHRSFWLLYCYAKAVSMSYLLKAEVEARLKDREMVLAGKIGKLQTR